MKVFFHKALFLLFIIFLPISTSCAINTEGQKIFGADAEYYIGLQLLSEGKTKEARVKFQKCVKKGSYYCALKSAQNLCTFGTITEKNLACKKLLEKYSDEESKLIAANHFYNSNEYDSVLSITDNINFETADNKLIKLRLLALKKKNDPRFMKETFKWFDSCKVSSEHYTFFRDEIDLPVLSEEETADESEYTPELFAINYRIELYKKNYLYCYDKAPVIFSYFENHQIEPSSQLASDIGKAFLYGNSNLIQNADYFVSLAEKYSDTWMSFYFWFYAGRLYEKGGMYYQKSKNAFINAIKSGKNNSQKDNALWYLLDNSLNHSINAVIEDLKEYSSQWSDPEYFEDFFDTLSVTIFSTGKWEAFGEIYKTIEGYASPENTAQYAYIYGRLIQKNILKVDSDEDEIKKAFETAMNSGSQKYYRAIANLQLTNMGYTSQQINEITKKITNKNQVAPDVNAEIFLKGFAYFGFPEKIYENWLLFGKKKISDECSAYLSQFLNDCSTGTDDYLFQSISIASFMTENLKHAYPENYKEIVEKYADEYKLEPAVMYALIRAESYFKPTANSSAGAIGLTQLMDFTASDIARRLHLKNYDLEDPDTNIRFGAYYLADLQRRFDNSYLLAFFAYNAGATRVRRWLQTSVAGFGKKSDMPLDLFLESLPYSETREYGRKLISATVIYDWLYSENPDETAHNLFNLLIKRN